MVMLKFEREKYSAILVTHNAESDLKRAIDSIRNQEIPPSEIIVVDDCSSDNTVLLANQLLADFPEKVIATNIANMGQSHSRNFAASVAKFENLIFFDDDDFSLTSRSVLHLQQLEFSDLSYVSSTKFYSDLYEVACSSTDFTLPSEQYSEMIEYLLLGRKIQNNNLYVPSSTLACRRSAMLHIGGFDVSYRRQEDVDFAIRSAIEGLRISWVASVGVQRHHTTNGSKGLGIDSSYELLLISKFQSFLGLTRARQARFLSRFRKFYFAKNYIKLISLLLGSPYFWWFALRRSPSLVRRILHEARM